MTIPTIFETCQPRSDILQGARNEEDFAADLAQVIRGTGSPEYLDATRFFANTYPTRGLKNLLTNVCGRLSGSGSSVASIFRLDTSYGGGKSHGLIALCHAAQSGHDIPNMEEFVDPVLIPSQAVRIAAFDGENADPSNGRKMEDGCLAYTPWGELAWALGGRDGYERVRASDENGAAPGAETLRELFGGGPVLILLDELSVYLRKVRSMKDARGQLTAFLTSLFKAVESAPNAVLVYTLAVGKDGKSVDAYAEENLLISDRMAEAESVSARKATLLNPTEEDETAQVLRRRLFSSIDQSAANMVAEAYRKLWNDHRNALPGDAIGAASGEELAASYPLHPEALATLTAKTSTLGNFQRVRGMLRLLAHTVSQLWREKPDDATAIHLHHIDPGFEPVRQEILTRLGQSAFAPAISNDISAPRKDNPSLAQRIDIHSHRGYPPFAAYVARAIFMHTLAFNERLKGVSAERLRYSVSGPRTDVSFIEDARKTFMAESAYLDDRPGPLMRFRAEANLSQIIRQKEDHVDPEEARGELHDRIRGLFEGKPLSMALFPGGPYEAPDDIVDGAPKLVVMGYDATTVGESVDCVPDLIERIFTRAGAEGGALRRFRNNLVFVVADEGRKDEMRRKIVRRFALREMKRPEYLSELAEYQQEKVRELDARSETELALAIAQCYRHIFYPSRNRIGQSNVDLAHTAIDLDASSEKPGKGQLHIVRALRNLGKLRLPEDDPDSPTYVRDRTPLKKGQISVMSLRNEFRADPALPMLVGDDVFRRGVKKGIAEGEYVYQRGDLKYGPGDPDTGIEIDEKSTIFTMAFAKEKGLWPRPPSPRPGSKSDGVVADTSTGGEAPRQSSVKLDAQQTPAAPATSLQFEGPLREALVRLWEKARAKNVDAIPDLRIRMFDALDAFRLFVAVGAIPGAEKTISIKGRYETRAGGELEMDFKGSVADAQPVREFLEPQLRDAEPGCVQFEVGFDLVFKDGLSMKGEEAGKLTERLSRYASSATWVSTTVDSTK